MLAVQDLKKAYADNQVLRGVSLEVSAGEIVALLGPNGAGKSTLIGCLSGATEPDEGTVTIGGETHGEFTPRSARQSGIAIIYQHLSLVPSLNVVDNMFLGDELTRWGALDRRTQRVRAQEVLSRLDVDLPLDVPVGRLSTGQRQLVEIAKALRLSPRLLVLDEPTAALGVAETHALLRVVRNLAASGLGILYVTHLLEEVDLIADRVVVLRDGAVVLDRAVAATSHAELVDAISPGASSEVRATSTNPTGAPVLTCEGLSGPGFGPLDLRVGGGEVVGVFGLLGSGRTELLETIVGARPSTGGEVEVSGSRFARRSPARSRRRGVYLVPADRAEQGLFAPLRSDENVVIPTLGRIRRGLRNEGAEREAYLQIATELSLRPVNARLPSGSLSGGNQQKLMLGRYIHRWASPVLILLDEPTQGVDVGSRYDIYRQLRKVASDRGAGLLFTSSEPDEVVLLADRAVVLHRGRVAAELSGDSLTHDRLLSAAHVASTKETP